MYFSLIILIIFLIIKSNDAYIVIQGKSVEFIKYQEDNALPWNISLEVVQSDYPNDMTGKLVYLDFPDYSTEVFILPYVHSINEYAKRGAIGIITSQKNDRRYYGIYYYNSIYEDTAISTGFISRSVYNEFLSDGRMVNVTFYSWDKNPYDAIYQSRGFNYAYRILLPIMYFFNMILCVYKVVIWRLKKGKFTLSIGLICLILEFFSNLDRFILSIVFPTYNLYALPALDLALTIPMCLNLITGILVIFFWFDLTLDPFFHKSGKCLGLMRIPSIVTVTVLILIEISIGLLRNLLPLDIFSFFFGVYYMVLKSLLAIFYFIAAVKIILISKKSAVKEKFREITYRVVYSGVATIGSALCMILLSSRLVYPPIGYVVDWFFLNVFWFLQSLCLVSIFTPEKKKKVKSSSKSPKFELSTSSPKSTSSSISPKVDLSTSAPKST